MNNIIIEKPNKNATDIKDNMSKSRRKVLMGILGFAGCVGTLSTISSFHKAIAAPLDTVQGKQSLPKFYTKSEFELVSQLADIIIPQTDTAGALVVGVPLLMDKLYAEWASTTSKIHHRKVIAKCSVELNSVGGGDFLNHSAEKKYEIVSQFDQKAFSQQQDDSKAYIELKELITRFYYLSEEGATKELRYERIPGRWEACIPFKQVGRTWAR